MPCRGRAAVPRPAGPCAQRTVPASQQHPGEPGAAAGGGLARVDHFEWVHAGLHACCPSRPCLYRSAAQDHAAMKWSWRLWKAGGSMKHACKQPIWLSIDLEYAFGLLRDSAVQ